MTWNWIEIPMLLFALTGGLELRHLAPRWNRDMGVSDPEATLLTIFAAACVVTGLAGATMMLIGL